MTDKDYWVLTQQCDKTTIEQPHDAADEQQGLQENYSSGVEAEQRNV